jgi:L-aminopeptidase/D-esterase-like protein
MPYQVKMIMPTPGRLNSITDIDGLLAGHYSDMDAACGVTVIICPEGAVAAVDIRGSAPGTRETDVLAPGCLVEKVQAIVLSGGSVYGLAAADGVTRWLAEQGWGFPLDESHVAPIVPAAVLYDLGRGNDFVPPIDASWGRMACEAAQGGVSVAMGNVGAGTGALSGGMKGGLGCASRVMDSGITVAALAAVNSLGSAVNPATGELWEKRLEINGEFCGLGDRQVHLPDPPEPSPGKNTIIAVVAVDAVLSRVQARKIAQMAHDGFARAVRPAHTMFDGDTVFCMATGKRDLPTPTGFFASPHAQAVNDLGHAGADCMARAMIHAVLSAESHGAMVAYKDLEQK